MLQLVAQGSGGDTDQLQRIANQTEGSGVLEFDLDTEINIPGPNIKLGGVIRAGIKALEFILKEIPGVHLYRPMTFTEANGRGKLRIFVRNNPVPIVLGPLVAAVLPWLLRIGGALLGIFIGWKLFMRIGGALLGIIIGWKLFKGEAQDLTKFLLIIAVVAAAGFLLFFLAKGKVLQGSAPG